MKLSINPYALDRLNDSCYTDVLSVKDVQQILGVCRISVYRLIKSNQINAFQIGRTYMIPKRAVQAFLEERRG